MERQLMFTNTQCLYLSDHLTNHGQYERVCAISSAGILILISVVVIRSN